MEQYQALLAHVLNNGTYKPDRTNTGTYSVFGHQMRFDLQKGFPLVTTKKVYWKGVVAELLWFLQGRNDVKWLQDRQCHICDSWMKDDGSLGPIYGVQWRSWPDNEGGTIDQLSEVLGLLKEDPSSRRMVVSAWNVAQLKDMALMPCHTMFQFYVADGKLSCQLYQRSADVFLGVPFNIASYALLTHLMAQQTGLEVGEFIWTGGDVHLYSNHVEQAQEQLKREPFPLPKLVIKDKAKDLFSYDMDSFELEGYVSHPPIKAPVAV